LQVVLFTGKLLERSIMEKTLNNKKITVIISCSVLFIVLNGCCPTKPSFYIGTSNTTYFGKKEYDEKANPKSYIFNASIKQIKGSFKNYEKRHKDCLALEKPLDYRRTYFEDYFDIRGNENDLCIKTYWITTFDTSEIYYSMGSKLQYAIEFCCHLTKIDETKTKVDIIITEEKVFLGKCFNLHQLSSVDELVAVEPTSIETYKILKEIGAWVGEKNMPELNLP
jgi:hypothetical protein